MKKALFIICLGFLFGCLIEPIPQTSQREVTEKVIYIQDHGHDHKEYIYRKGCSYRYSYYHVRYDELVYERQYRDKRKRCKRKLYIPHH